MVNGNQFVATPDLLTDYLPEAVVSLQADEYYEFTNIAYEFKRIKVKFPHVSN